MPMLPQFSSFIQDAGTMDVRISVHYTKATLTDVEMIQDSLPTGITLSVGRPILSNIIESVIDRTCTKVGILGIRKGIVVGVCGPIALGEEVRKVVGAVESVRQLAVGGIELCDELVLHYDICGTNAYKLVQGIQLLILH
jgi:ferric-chelate reductase